VEGPARNPELRIVKPLGCGARGTCTGSLSKFCVIASPLGRAVNWAVCWKLWLVWKDPAVAALPPPVLALRAGCCWMVLELRTLLLGRPVNQGTAAAWDWGF